jgi:CheY-like chemotaxis protein
VPERRLRPIFDAIRGLNPQTAAQYQNCGFIPDFVPKGVSKLGTNPTILVVEDEPLVAMVLENIIEDMGASLAGPAASVAKALQLIEAGGFNGALLDVNLRGERVDAVADALAAKGIPFVFTTGHGIDGIPPAHRHRPMLSKPFRDADIMAALNRHVLAKQAIS